MDVREAVGAAKDYVARVFAEEDIGSIGLEEVEFDYDSECLENNRSASRGLVIDKTAFKCPCTKPSRRKTGAIFL